MNFRLIIQNSTGSDKYEIPSNKWKFVEELNKDRSGEIDINFQAIKEIGDVYGLTPKYILSASYREIYVYDDNNFCLYGGYIAGVTTTKNEKGDLIKKVSTKGFFNLLDKRLTNLVSEIKKVYTQQKASAIIKDLILYTQALPYGNLGIVVGAEANDVLNDRTFQYDTIKSAIEKLGNNETWDGVDFEITHQKILNTYFPKKGQNKEDFKLVDGFNILAYEIKENLVDSMINQVTVCGDGTGDEMLVTQRDSEEVYKQTFFLLQSALAEKDIKTTENLQKKGDKQLDTFKYPKNNIKITCDYRSPIYANYSVGDSIKIEIPDEAINDFFRVYKRQVEQDGTVTLDFLPN